MEFTAEHFKRCLFNPLDKGFYGKSEKLKAFESEKLVKFLIFMYDPASPYRSEYPDYAARLEAASADSGFEPDNENDKHVLGTIEFLKMVNNRVWANIQAIEYAIWEQRKRMLTPVKFGVDGFDKESMSAVNMKGATANSIIELDEKLDLLYGKFYGHDPELQRAAEGVMVEFTPQQMSKMLKAQ